MKVALFGAGTVGTAVASLLKEAGHRIVSVGPEDRASTRPAADILRAEGGDVAAADVVLVGAPDRALEDVARTLAPRLAHSALVCHFAGSFGVEPLTPVLDAGAVRAATHPVQACPDIPTAMRRLPGSAWGITCDEAATERVVALVQSDLSGRVVFVEEAARPVWHAATATTANGIAALLSLSEDMLEAIGVNASSGALGPLAAGVVANSLEDGGAATLTGPIVRGDVGTVRRHIESLERLAPESLLGYRRAAAVVLTAAQASGRVDDATAARMRDLLESP